MRESPLRQTPIDWRLFPLKAAVMIPLNKLIGATMMVSASTVGGGMLVLPLAAASIGFWPALLLMLCCWAVSSLSALLVIETSHRNRSSLSYHNLFGKVLGPKGQLIAMLAICWQFYALIAAYLSGGGSLLKLRLHGHLAISNEMSSLLFTLVLGLIAALALKHALPLTKVLISLLTGTLLMVLVGLMPQFELAQLTQHHPFESGNLWLAAVPILLISFGFHGCLPSLANYLDGNHKRLRRVLLLGSLIPLLFYCLWLVATLGAMPPPERSMLIEGDRLVELMNHLAQQTAFGAFAGTLQMFANLALITSFLGVSAALYNYLTELFNLGSSLTSKTITWAITFIPALALAVTVPGGFAALLGYAAIPRVVLTIFLPLAVIYLLKRNNATSWQQRKLQAMPTPVRTPMLTSVHSVLLVCGVLVVYAQLVVA